MPTPAVEEYLEVIYMLEAEGQTVKGARLAKTMGVSRPAVAATLRRMARDGLVRVKPNKDIQLSKRGFTMADDLQRRHRIVERWLTDTLGFDWAKSDAEAHRLEHVMSDEVIERLNEMLGRPATCPHGNPIPGNSRPGTQSNVFQLSRAEQGERVRVSRISEYAENVAEILSYLGDCGLKPGAEVTIADVASLHNSITLQIDDKHFSLTPILTDYVWVSREQ